MITSLLHHYCVIITISLLLIITSLYRHHYTIIASLLYHYYSFLQFHYRQFPRCRISTPVMPTRTWPRRAPPAGTAAAKKRSTTATPTSTRDVAAAGATCWDGRGEKDVHHGDDSERWPRPAPTAAAGGHGGEDGRATPLDMAGAGGAGRWSWPAQEARTGALPPGTWPLPAPAAPWWGLEHFRQGSFVCLQ